MPGARCARSLACKIKKHTSIVTTVTPVSPDIPRAMVLTAYLVLSPVTGLFCHRRPRKLPSANLTPASGRQDHTTSPSAYARFVKRAISVHRIPPRVRDDRERPSEGRDGENHTDDSISEKQKDFCKGDWTRHNSKASGRQSDLPVGQIGLQGFIMMGLSAEQSPSLRRSDCCEKEFPQQRQIAARIVRTRAWRPLRNRRWQGAATAAPSRHCRIASRIVRLPQHRCWPAKAAARGGACSSMVRAGRS
jgi:hypothetical protein